MREKVKNKAAKAAAEQQLADGHNIQRNIKDAKWVSARVLAKMGSLHLTSRVHCWTEGMSCQRKCNQSRQSNEKENESCSKCKQSQHSSKKMDTSQFTISKNSPWMIVKDTSNISMLQKILQCQRILQEGGSVALKWCIMIPLLSYPTTVMTTTAVQKSEGGTKQSKLLLQRSFGWG